MSEFKFACSHCGQHIACDPSMSGQQILCPTCQRAIVIPGVVKLAPGPLATVEQSGRPPPLPRFPDRPTPRKLKLCGWALASLVIPYFFWFFAFVVAILAPQKPLSRQAAMFVVFALALGHLSSSITGIICGHVALSRIKRSDGILTGRLLAIIGLISSYGLLTLIVLGGKGGLSRTGVFNRPKANIPEIDLKLASADTVQCVQNLRKIREAIEAYRQQRQDLPNWLSDLVPQFVSDQRILICPISKRSGTYLSFGIDDPRKLTSYTYEFCPAPMGQVWNGGQISMREWKRRQMRIVGPEVPIVRCHLHEPVLNLSVGGKVYESPRSWEYLFSNQVSLVELSPQRLFANEPLGKQKRP